MNGPTAYLELRCPRCSWSELCGTEGMARWLAKARKLRPGREPDAEILAELFRVAAPGLACPACGETGLAAGLPEEDRFDWPGGRNCEACKKAIPRERLEALPEAVLCAACQRDEELGRGKTEPDYCPRCGSPMELRLSRAGGITRYALACTAQPPCRL